MRVTMRTLRNALSVMVLVTAALAVAGAGSARVLGVGRQEPSAARSDTLAAFLRRGIQPPLRYSAHRRLEAANPRLNKEAWLEATTEFDLERGFTYQVVGEGGSSMVRGRVLRKALETEAESLAVGAKDAALVEENYVITDAGETEEGLVRLRLEPKRKDRLLLDGFVVVTPGDAALVRIEGRLAKNPSFWTTRVEIVRRYQHVLGFNVPVDVESHAQVRIFGASSFRMKYQYDSVNGIAVPPGEQIARSEATAVTAALRWFPQLDPPQGAARLF